MSKKNDKKRYHIQRNDYATIFLVLAIVCVICAELLAYLSSRANASYAIGNITLIMQLSEISATILILIYILSPYMRGKVGMYLIDIGRLAAVVMMTIDFCLVLQARTTLIGYVWISGLESGNGVEQALNYGVISAALYAGSIIFCAITCGFEFVNARKVKRTPKVIRNEIKDLENELKSIEVEGWEEQQILQESLTDGLIDEDYL